MSTFDSGADWIPRLPHQELHRLGKPVHVVAAVQRPYEREAAEPPPEPLPEPAEAPVESFVDLKALDQHELIEQVHSRCRHYTRCLRAAGEAQAPLEHAFHGLRDLVLRAVRESFRRTSQADARADGLRKELLGKDKELERLRDKVEQVKADMQAQLRTHIEELNAKWHDEKSKTALMHEQLEAKLRIADEMHKENPIHELRAQCDQLSTGLEKKEALNGELQLKLQIARQELDQVEMEAREQGLEQGHQALHLQQARQQAQELQDQERELRERLKMQDEEAERLRSLLAAEQQSNKLLITHAANFFGPGADAANDKAVKMYRVAAANTAYLHNYLPYFSDLHGDMSRHNRQYGAMKVGDVAQFGVSDPQMYKLKESLEEPLQVMEQQLAGLRYAMAAARNEPVTDPQESPPEREPPSILEMLGLPVTPPRRHEGEFSPFSHHAKKLFSVQQTRALIRAIYDSKACETLMAGENFREITPLPDFVLAWLEKYDVNLELGRICAREAATGYLGLEDEEQVALESAWASPFEQFAHSVQAYRYTGYEIHTFAGFLFEELAPDVLAFFLTIRYVVLDGKELTGKDAFVLEERLESMEQARKAIALVLARASQEEKDTFFAHMEECLVGGLENPKCRSTMFIRFLTEEYRIERAQRLQCLDSLVAIAFKLGPGIVEDPLAPQEKPGPVLRLQLGDPPKPKPRLIKTLRIEQVQNILEALLPASTLSLPCIAFLVFRTACRIGRGVVDARSLRRAIEVTGVLQLCLRLQLHVLTTQNVMLLNEQSERLLEWVKAHKEDLESIGAVGPVPRLVELALSGPVYESIAELSHAYFTLVRFVVNCRVYLDTAPCATPRKSGRKGVDECALLRTCYDALFRCLTEHFPDEEPKAKAKRGL